MIEVYTRESYCGWCIRAKDLLRSKNLEFKEFIVNVDISRDDFIHKFWRDVTDVQPTVPQIVINGEWIGGYEDLVAYFEKEDSYEWRTDASY